MARPNPGGKPARAATKSSCNPEDAEASGIETLKRRAGSIPALERQYYQ
jgi:hypothetical protein